LAGPGAQSAISNNQKNVANRINNPTNPDDGTVTVIVMEGHNTLAHLNPNTNNQRNSTGRGHASGEAACPQGHPTCFRYVVTAKQAANRTVAQLAQDCVQRMLEEREKGANYQTCVVATPNVQSARDLNFNRDGLRISAVTVGELITANVCRTSTRSLVTVLESASTSADFYPPNPDGSCVDVDETMEVCRRSDDTKETIFKKDYNPALHYQPNPDGSCGGHITVCRRSDDTPVTIRSKDYNLAQYYRLNPDGTCGGYTTVCRRSDDTPETIRSKDFNSALHYNLPCRTRPIGMDVCLRSNDTRTTILATDFNSALHYNLPCGTDITVCLRSDDTPVTIRSKDFDLALHYDLPCGTDITVCLRSNDTPVTIRSKDFDPALHYNLVNNKCTGGSSTGRNGGSSSGRNGGSSSGRNGGSSSGGSSSGGSSSGRNDGSDPGSGSDPDNSNDTGIPYYEWPEYAIDPATGRPYTVTVRVSLIVPENYVANGKKTTLSYKVDVLCGSAANRVSCQSAEVKVSGITLILNQGSTHSSMKPCSSMDDSACGYYAPQHAKPLTGQTGTFDLYFYTPIHANHSARTTIAISSITIERELNFFDGSTVIVAVDNYSTEYTVNGKSSSPVIDRKILGSFGGV